MSEQNDESADERLIEELAKTRYESGNPGCTWALASMAAKSSNRANAQTQLALLRAAGATITLPEPPKRYPVEGMCSSGCTSGLLTQARRS